MPKAATAKLFMNGRSQAVRLPKEFRFKGDRVRIRKVKGGVFLEPADVDVDAWFARLDSYNAEPLFPEGRQQPPIQRRKFNFK
jgi:antitoxin VapB